MTSSPRVSSATLVRATQASGKQSRHDDESPSCNSEPEDFEAHGYRYINHLKYDHNMVPTPSLMSPKCNDARALCRLAQWQYVWLKVYLQEKNPVDYRGVELFIAPLLREHSPRCMPIKRARAIQVPLPVRSFPA
jgi:hypothetical protein